LRRVKLLTLVIMLVTTLVSAKQTVHGYVECENHFRYAPCVAYDEGTYRIVTSWSPYKMQDVNKSRVIHIDGVYLVIR
jgi:hypothetical protein